MSATRNASRATRKQVDGRAWRGAPCGRCGVYRHLHPERGCGKSRRSYWLDRHQPIRHVVGLAWLALPEPWRWKCVTRLRERRTDLCWCDLVDTAMLTDKAQGYRAPWGCGCDVPLPSDVGRPVPGRCYWDPS